MDKHTLRAWKFKLSGLNHPLPPLARNVISRATDTTCPNLVEGGPSLKPTTSYALRRFVSRRGELERPRRGLKVRWSFTQCRRRRRAVGRGRGRVYVVPTAMEPRLDG